MSATSNLLARASFIEYLNVLKPGLLGLLPKKDFEALLQAHLEGEDIGALIRADGQK